MLDMQVKQETGTSRAFGRHSLNMKLYIKNMISAGSKELVRDELKKLGFHFTSVGIGVVEVRGEISIEQMKALRMLLATSGLELMGNYKVILIEKIKHVIIEMVNYADEMPKVKNSNYLSFKLNHDYTYMANLFSEVVGVTIERYIIANKIERVKQLLLYDELNLTQISYKMNYSSVAHLSNQFKKVTGTSPSEFKQLKEKISASG